MNQYRRFDSLVIRSKYRSTSLLFSSGLGNARPEPQYPSQLHTEHVGAILSVNITRLLYKITAKSLLSSNQQLRSLPHDKYT